MHSPPGPQQLADTMSGLQLTENVVQTECSNDAITSMEDSNQLHGEPDFPVSKLNMLHEKISSPRWVVPVLPEQELECLLQASIDLCKKGGVLFLICLLPTAVLVRHYDSMSRLYRSTCLGCANFVSIATFQELMYKARRVNAFFEKVSQSHLPRY